MCRYNEAAAECESVTELMLVAADNLILILRAGTAGDQRRGVGTAGLSNMAAGYSWPSTNPSSARTGILVEHAAVEDSKEKERTEMSKALSRKNVPSWRKHCSSIGGWIEISRPVRGPNCGRTRTGNTSQP